MPNPGSLVTKLVNAILNLAGNANTGGIVPNLAAGATMTASKSYAALATYGQLSTAANSTTIGEAWIYALFISVLYISGGVHYQGMTAFGAGGAEVNTTGSAFGAGHSQSTAAGEVMDCQWQYGSFPIHWAAGTRLSGATSSANAANDVSNLAAAYKTNLGT